MLLSEAIKALAITTRASGCSLATARAYERKLRPLVDYLGDVPIEGVTTADLRSYVVHLMDEVILYRDHPQHKAREGRLSPFTIAGRVKVVKRLFNFCEAEGIIQTNPARRVKIPQPRRDEPKGIERQDFLALLATCEGNTVTDRRDQAILLFLRDSACRVGGLVGLRIGDLDLAGGLARLREKGGKVRLAFFSEPTAAALTSWLAVRPQVGHDAVFVTLANRAWGTALTDNGVRHLLKQRAKIAGVTGPVNPHSFRHAFARDYLLAGGDLATLCDIMGHSSVEITKRYYAIFSIAELQAQHRKYSPVQGDDDGRDC